MADDTPTGPVEMGAEMDYAEHDKTYHRFLTLAKFGSLVCGGLLVAMAFAFFTTAGFFSAHGSFHSHLRGRLLPAALTPGSSAFAGRGRRNGDREGPFQADRGVSVGTDCFHSKGDRRERTARGGLARHGEAHGRARLRGGRRSRRGRVVARTGRRLCQCGCCDRHGRRRGARRRGAEGQAADRGRAQRLQEGRRRHRHHGSLRQRRGGQVAGRCRRHGLRHGVHAAHHARAVDGRAVQRRPTWPATRRSSTRRRNTTGRCR